MNRRGLMLLNLGTPDSPEVPDVRRYLEEFLMDPRVLDTPYLRRWLLVHWLILPRRPKASAAAYKKVWTDRGSPLLFHGLDLLEKMRARLGPDVRVEFAMRYQNPSIASVLDVFRDDGIDQVVVLPLFPQYTSAATGSAIEKVFEEAAKRWNVPAIQVVPPFYDHAGFLDSFASVARPVIGDLAAEKVLMSFHGLPERHLRKSDESRGKHCLVQPDCCDAICPANRNCYRAHCYATARGIAERLELAEDAWEVTFQSRLGRTPWIRPYTDVRVVEMAREGTKRVAVMCPAFVADCLETIEEIGMRARDDFCSNGGEALELVPSLNSEDCWVDALVEILRQSTSIVS